MSVENENGWMHVTLSVTITEYIHFMLFICLFLIFTFLFHTLYWISCLRHICVLTSLRIRFFFLHLYEFDRTNNICECVLLRDFGPCGITVMTMCAYYFRFSRYTSRVSY
jgi:hypothetical protein